MDVLKIMGLGITQMNRVLIGNGLLLDGSSLKTKDKQIPIIQLKYMCFETALYILIT